MFKGDCWMNHCNRRVFTLRVIAGSTGLAGSQLQAE
jgi:hypothetical protein